MVHHQNILPNPQNILPNPQNTQPNQKRLLPAIRILPSPPPITENLLEEKENGDGQGSSPVEPRVFSLQENQKINPALLSSAILAAIAEVRSKNITPLPPPLLNPELEDRRQAHILSEKKRREHINIGFEHLRSILPNCNGTSDSKATVLLKGIAYIEKLQAENLFLKQHLQQKNNLNGNEFVTPLERPSIPKSSQLDISSDNMVKQHYLGQYKRIYSFSRPPPLSPIDSKLSRSSSQYSEPNPDSEEYTLAASLSMLRNNSSPTSE